MRVSTPELFFLAFAALLWLGCAWLAFRPGQKGTAGPRGCPDTGDSAENEAQGLAPAEGISETITAGRPLARPGPVLPPSEPFDPHWHRWPNYDAALSGLARHEAADWSGWHDYRKCATGGDDDPEQPWRAGE